jgi:ABC-type cobalt transport system substrate-binding protein
MSTRNGNDNGNHKTSEVPLKERRALVQRVLWSREVARSERTRDFLTYVCDRALEDQDVQVHEQEIGHNVFGRPADYNPHDDNIVRVTAGNTRRKLEQYFNADGLSEPVILEIPKGKYTPIFRERDSSDTGETASSLLQIQAKLGLYRRVLVLLGACALLLFSYALWSTITLRNVRRALPPAFQENSALNALWSQLLVPTSHMDIIVTDSSLDLIEKLEGRQIGLVEYLNPNQWMVDAKLKSDPTLNFFSQWTARQGLTSMASVRTVYRIAQLTQGDQGRISILRPRDFNMTQMKSDNVILLGSTRANPWEYLIDSQLHFQFGWDQKLSCNYFESLDPLPGAQVFDRCAPNVSYVRIAFVPNLTGTGNVLSIEGTDSEGTEGGGEFMTDESSVEKLLALVGGGHGGGRIPPFEALLEGSRVGGQTSHLSIIAFRRVEPAAPSNSPQAAPKPH